MRHGVSNAMLRRGVRFLVPILVVAGPLVARATDIQIADARMDRLEYSASEQGTPIGSDTATQPWISDYGMANRFTIKPDPAFGGYATGDKVAVYFIGPGNPSVLVKALELTAILGPYGYPCFPTSAGCGGATISFSAWNQFYDDPRSHTVGRWRTEIYVNNVLKSTQYFDIRPYTMSAVSGSGQSTPVGPRPTSLCASKSRTPTVGSPSGAPL